MTGGAFPTFAPVYPSLTAFVSSPPPSGSLLQLRAGGKGQWIFPTCRCELRGASREQTGTGVPIHCTTTSGRSPAFTERHWQGGLHLEDTVPGWNDPGSVRAGGFHRTVGSTCPETSRQPHPLPRRHCPKSPLAWAGHISPARERHQAYRQRRSPHGRRAPRRHDLGSATQASFQLRHRTLQPLRGDCEGHRLYRGPRRHR